MAEGGLGGQVHTPFGSVKKEYLFVGGGVFLLLLIVFYRQKKAQQAAATANAGANTGIDPATGFPYGSAEDVAALANQGNYINPTQPFAPGGGGSGGGYPTPNTGPGTFTNNAQWAQYAEQYMYTNGQVTDLGPLSNAIGKYLAGQPTSADEHSLVNQAIAIGGYPPVAGPNGMPPSFNTAPPGNTQPPSGNVPGKPENLHFVRATNSSITVTWTRPLSGVSSWKIQEQSQYGHSVRTTDDTSANPEFTLSGLAINTPHTITVSGINAAGEGPAQSITASTTR